MKTGTCLLCEENETDKIREISNAETGHVIYTDHICDKCKKEYESYGYKVSQ